jgi:hypothetical protein
VEVPREELLIGVHDHFVDVDGFVVLAGALGVAGERVVELPDEVEVEGVAVVVVFDVDPLVVFFGVQQDRGRVGVVGGA